MHWLRFLIFIAPHPFGAPLAAGAIARASVSICRLPESVLAPSDSSPCFIYVAGMVPLSTASGKNAISREKRLTLCD